MARRRRRHAPGALSKLGTGLFAGLQWLLDHPHPFVALLIALGSFVWISQGITRSDAFRVETIEIPEASGLKAPEHLKGESMWAVDLRDLAESLNAQQPELAWGRVTRVLPNTLRVETKAREAAAQVQLGQWHAVDADGFVFSPASTDPVEGLVILKGIGDPKSPVKAGRRNENARLLGGLRVVASLKDSTPLRDHHVVSVDVSDRQQLTFTLENDMEIRCGSEEELASQLERLRGVLARVAKQTLDIRYIDVRFPEPVIGPRT